MPEGERSDGAPRVLSLGYLLGALRISVPADVWYCNGIPSLGDDHESGDGGHGGESSCNSRRATPVLEAVCR